MQIYIAAQELQKVAKGTAKPKYENNSSNGDIVNSERNVAKRGWSERGDVSILN